MIDEVAKDANFTRKDVKIILLSFIKVLKNRCKKMQDGERFTLTHFATFKAFHRKERTVINPNTGDINIVPEAMIIKIRPTTSFYNSVNGIVGDAEMEDE